MKFRGIGNANSPVNDLVVVVNPHDQSLLDLSIFSTGCRFVESMDEAVSLMSMARGIAIVDSRPEVVAHTFVNVAPKLTESPDKVLALLLPRWNAVGTLRYTSKLDVVNELALCRSMVSRSQLFLEFEQANDSDRHLGAFLAGYELAMTESPGDMKPAATRDDDCVDCRDTTSRLVNLIESIDMVGISNDSASRRTVESIRVLEMKLERAIQERDTLQLKYRALANSRLGQLTLRYWRMRRKGRRYV